VQYLVAFFFMLLSFAGTSLALAQSNEELADLARPILDAVLGGDYAAAAAAGLVLVVALVRRFGGRWWPVVASKSVAPLLVALGSFFAAIANSLGAGEAFSASVAFASFKIAIYAGGGYSMLKPLVQLLARVAPAWARPLLASVSWIFDSKSRAQRVREAGEAAVKDKPASGAGIGFTDFPPES
jgi:hypothetical protein